MPEIQKTQAPAAPIVPAAPAPQNALQKFFDEPAVKAKLAEAVHKFMSPDDMVRLGLMAVSRNPKLLQCSPQSMLRALIEAADVRIRPLGTNGRGYLIPRKNKNTGHLEACFDPGYRGLIDIAKRGGDVVEIDAYPVYKADEFHYQLGDAPSVRHVPNITAEDRGPIVAAYAVAHYADGRKQIEVVPAKDLQKIRDTSPAKEGGPWKSWEEEMARKSAVRRLCKYLPADDPALETALELANEVDKPEPALPHGDTRELENALMGDVVVTADGEVVS
jgi:recombination protein RecT